MIDAIVRQKCAEIVNAYLGIGEDRLTDDATLSRDLSCDSLDVVDMVMGVEDHFHVEITDDDMAAVTTFGELWRLALAKVDAKNAQVVA